MSARLHLPADSRNPPFFRATKQQPHDARAPDDAREAFAVHDGHRFRAWSPQTVQDPADRRIDGGCAAFRDLASGQAIVFSGDILPGQSLAVLATYAVGDLIGLVVTTLTLMLIFRSMRLFPDRG